MKNNYRFIFYALSGSPGQTPGSELGRAYLNEKREISVNTQQERAELIEPDLSTMQQLPGSENYVWWDSETGMNFVYNEVDRLVRIFDKHGHPLLNSVGKEMVFIYENGIRPYPAIIRNGLAKTKTYLGEKIADFWHETEGARSYARDVFGFTWNGLHKQWETVDGAVTGTLENLSENSKPSIERHDAVALDVEIQQGADIIQQKVDAELAKLSPETMKMKSPEDAQKIYQSLDSISSDLASDPRLTQIIARLSQSDLPEKAGDYLRGHAQIALNQWNSKAGYLGVAWMGGLLGMIYKQEKTNDWREFLDKTSGNFIKTALVSVGAVLLIPHAARLGGTMAGAGIDFSRFMVHPVQNFSDLVQSTEVGEQIAAHEDVQAVLELFGIDQRQEKAEEVATSIERTLQFFPPPIQKIYRKILDKEQDFSPQEIHEAVNFIHITSDLQMNNQDLDQVLPNFENESATHTQMAQVMVSNIRMGMISYFMTLEGNPTITNTGPLGGDNIVYQDRPYREVFLDAWKNRTQARSLETKFATNQPLSSEEKLFLKFWKDKKENFPARYYEEIRRPEDLRQMMMKTDGTNFFDMKKESDELKGIELDISHGLSGNLVKLWVLATILTNLFKVGKKGWDFVGGGWWAGRENKNEKKKQAERQPNPEPESFENGKKLKDALIGETDYKNVLMVLCSKKGRKDLIKDKSENGNSSKFSVISSTKSDPQGVFALNQIGAILHYAQNNTTEFMALFTSENLKFLDNDGLTDQSITEKFKTLFQGKINLPPNQDKRAEHDVNRFLSYWAESKRLRPFKEKNPISKATFTSSTGEKLEITNIMRKRVPVIPREWGTPLSKSHYFVGDFVGKNRSFNFFKRGDDYELRIHTKKGLSDDQKGPHIIREIGIEAS